MPTQLDEAVIRFEPERWRPAGLSSPSPRALQAVRTGPGPRRTWSVLGRGWRRPGGPFLAVVALSAVVAVGVVLTGNEDPPGAVPNAIETDLPLAAATDDQRAEPLDRDGDAG